MKQTLWLAIGVGAISLLLLVNGGIATSLAYGLINSLSEHEYLELAKNSLLLTEQIEMAKIIRPLIFTVAAQGVAFGICGLVAAFGFLRRRSWAPRLLLLGSVALALSSVAVIAFWPHLWDEQGIYILLSSLYWWSWHVRHSESVR